jgi:hypothetical protein
MTELRGILLVWFLPHEMHCSDAPVRIVCALNAYGVRNYCSTAAAFAGLASTALRLESIAQRRSSVAHLGPSYENDGSADDP